MPRGGTILENKKTFYATTSIAYASKLPHIGNTYELVQTDAIIRHKKLQGFDTYFLCGADEHGQKIGELAQEAKMDPQAYVDKVSGEIQETWDMLNVKYDQFIRTTSKKHKEIVQKMFKQYYDQGDIYKGAYEGWYCVPCESFFTESQLVDGKCPDCGREVELTKEEAYFFKMNKYQDRLLKHIEDNPDFIVPESRKKEMVNNFLKPGLQDLCVSRTSFKWGIPVTFDPEHVTYVWIDALSNYITALGFNPDGESDDLYKKYWPADLHVIGKDILRFHTIYWPIMLMALGQPLPKTVLGHPWLLSGVDKMSKSRGNVIYAKDLVRHFGVDGVRYYLLSEMPYAQDGTITYENVIVRYNTDLANTIGNLVNRTVAMCQKYFDGEIFTPSDETEFDSDLKAVCVNEAKLFLAAMDNYKLAEATQHIIAIAQRSNKYIDETMPWSLAKDTTKEKTLQTVLYNLLEAIRFIGVLSQSLIPQTANKIFEQINSDICSYSSLSTFGQLKSAQKVGTAEALFNRIDEKKKLEELQKEIESKQPIVEKEDKNTQGIITIEDFAKVSLKVAQVKACEPVAKSDKLLKLTLDDGGSGRQVVSGIAEFYTPEQLIGKKVIVVANLKPAKLRGELSEGMILAADSNKKIEVVFLPDSVPNGSVVR